MVNLEENEPQNVFKKGELVKTGDFDNIEDCGKNINQNGYFIMLNKKNRKIVRVKMILKNSNLRTFLEFLITNFLNQLEVQNNITLKSFDLKNNYALNLYSNTFYYFEKSIKNLYFKSVLNYVNIVAIFNFVNNTDLFDHIFYLNFFKFYFNK